MTQYINKTGKGFTLTETLVAMAIVVLVLGTILLAYNLSQRSYRGGEATAEITQNGRVILERLTREIRQAREIATELSENEAQAISGLMFEDGHIVEEYNYIRYFLELEERLIKREVLGFYFSGDSSQTLVPWDAIPPSGQTLEIKTIEQPQTIGEFVREIGFWGNKTINIRLNLEKADQEIELETSIFGRNL